MGLINKALSKTLGKVATKAAPKAALSLSEQAAEEAVTAAPPKLSLVKPKTTAKALKEAEPTPTPTAAVEEPEQGVFGSALSKEDQEFIKSLTSNETTTEGIAAQTEEALPMLKAESPYNFPNKAFTDEEYAAAEQYLKDNNTPSVFYAMKVDKEGFANQLQMQVAFDKGFKMKDLPSMPYGKKEEYFDDVVGADTIGVDTTAQATLPPPKGNVAKKIFSGKLGKAENSGNNQILEDIRQLREQNYQFMTELPQTKKFDQPVLDVAMGEFRHKYGYEYDPAIRNDNKRIVQLMEGKQAEYDRLKKKYADTPDISVYHGGDRLKIASIEAEGFRRPSLSKRTAQQELRTGATSMTTDIPLNFNPSAGFGGAAENILEKKMPYADYIFTRVNMKPSEYKNKDLDATARTITGSPTGVRALRLPRSSGFYETESAFIESDKMKMTKNIDDIQEKQNVYREILDKKRVLQDSLNNIDSNRYDKPFDKVSSVQAYNTIRKYLENEAKLGRIANVRSGIGEQYEQDMTSLFYRSDMLSDLSGALRRFGMTQKADNVEELYRIAERGMNKGETAELKQSLMVYNSEIDKMKAGLDNKYKKMSLHDLAQLADAREPNVRDFDSTIGSLYGILEQKGLSPKDYTVGQLLTMAQPEKHLGSDLLKLTDKFNRGGLVRRK